MLKLADQLHEDAQRGRALLDAELVAGAAPDTEDDLARAFVARFGSRFRWSPGLDWMIDTGAYWQRDEALRRFDCMRLVCRDAADMMPKDRKRLLHSATVAGALRLAQSDLQLLVRTDEWDADPHVLNTPGAVVDLRTGALRPRVEGDYFTQAAAVSPDPGMRMPVFLRFINEVFQHDAERIGFVQRMLGYCLTGDRREQVLFFWSGIGANGKSVLGDVVMDILGPYALPLPAEVLMPPRGDRHPTELAQLRGRRLALSSETEAGAHLAEARIKTLTGDATLAARFMRGDFFTFRQRQKHIIVGNHRPRLRGGDPAMARRIVLVEFLEKFEGPRRDDRLPEKLRAEYPAILAWMIEGARRWYAGGLQVPASVRAASADYLNEHDDVALWLEERCERTGTAKGSDLYTDFRQWKESRGEHAPSMTAWGDRMKLVPNVRKSKSDGSMRYSGLSLRPSWKAS